MWSSGPSVCKPVSADDCTFTAGAESGERRRYAGPVPARWTRLVIRFRLPVLVAWAALLVAGAIASGRLTPLLSNSFDVPGTDSDVARQLLASDFRERPDG